MIDPLSYRFFRRFLLMLAACLLPGMSLAQSSWTGATNNNWFNPGNWVSGVPGQLTTTTIPASLREPVIQSPFFNARSLTLQIGGGGGSSGLSIVGPGRLVVGAVNVGGLFGGGTGTLRIGNGGAPGTLSSPLVIVNVGSELEFNHNGNINFFPNIIGLGTLTHEGPGTTRLGGLAGNLIAFVDVSNGELIFAGNRLVQGTGFVLVRDGGQLTLESGLDLSANLTVQNGGVLENAGILRTFSPIGLNNGTLINRSGGQLLGSSISFLGSGNTSILVTGSGTILNEQGALIQGSDVYAIRTTDLTGNGLMLENSGEILGPRGILTTGNATILNHRTGLIRGTNGPAILYQGRNGTLDLTNLGRILGDRGTAISGLSGNASLSNMGRIEGDVLLSPTGNNQVTLYPGSTINGDLHLGGNPASRLTLTGEGTHRYSSVVTGTTTGAAGLRKTGASTWIVDRALGITGEATLEQGGLILNSVLSSSRLLVNPGTRLSGNGTVLGNLLNNGTLNPGTSPGTLRIGGDFIQGPSGILVVEIASTTSFDRLEVGGTASLDGRLAVVLIDGFVPESGDEFGIIAAEGGVEGSFNEIDDPSGADFGIGYDDNEVVLYVLADDGEDLVGLFAPTESFLEPFTSYAETPNQFEVAKALDSVRLTATGDLEDIINQLTFLPPDEIRRALDEISPQLVSSYAPITFTLNNAHAAQIQQRLRVVRDGTCGWHSPNDTVTNPHTEGAQVQGEDDPIRYEPENRWGVYAAGSGTFAKAQTIYDLPSYRFSSGSMLAGADYRVADCFFTGVYTGYAGTLADFADNSRLEANGVRFGTYATWKLAGFFLNAMVGGGYDAWSMKRDIQFGSISRNAYSTANGYHLQTLLGGGYDLLLGNFRLTLAASSQYTFLGISPFTERGADSLNTRVGSQSYQSLRTTVGGEISYTWEITKEVRVVPEVSAYWQHQFLDGADSFTASLQGGEGPDFLVYTEAGAANNVLAGAGLAVYYKDRWNAYFAYVPQFGGADINAHSILAGLGFGW